MLDLLGLGRTKVIDLSSSPFQSSEVKPANRVGHVEKRTIWLQGSYFAEWVLLPFLDPDQLAHKVRWRIAPLPWLGGVKEPNVNCSDLIVKKIGAGKQV